MQKYRVQIFNPLYKRWAKINIKTGEMVSYRMAKFPDVMTVEEREASPEYKEQLEIGNIIKTHKFKIDPKYAKRKIKCDCGHYSKEHYLGEGCCDECGCTWYYPNYKWIQKQQIKQAKEFILKRKK